MRWKTLLKPWLQSPEFRVNAVGLFSMAFLTWPLCGMLFLCGCTWLWQGGHRDCNYFKMSMTDRCPWCMQSAMSGLALLLVALAALLLSKFFQRHLHQAGMTQRLLVSCAAYTIFASLFAWLSAHITGYAHWLYY